MCTPDLANSACNSFKEYKEDPEVVPLDISEELIQWVATQLFGLAGHSITYAPDFQSWLLLFGKASADLRVDMAEW